MLNPPRRVGRLKHGKDVRLLDVFVRRSGFVPRAVGLRLRVDRTRIADEPTVSGAEPWRKSTVLQPPCVAGLGRVTVQGGKPVSGREVPSQKPTRLSRVMCRVCGGAIAGRRRNGFCSDRCRFQWQRERRSALFDRMVPDDPGRAE